MNLYNIHTHNVSIDCSDEYNVISIVNVLPLEFDLNEIIVQPNIYYSCGIHPWYLNDLEKQYACLGKIAQDKRIIGIGEAGLDKLCNSNFEIQKKAFCFQIELAEELQKPMIIHNVKAWDELIAFHKKYNPSQIWIIHGFRGNAKQAKQLNDIGFKFSFGSKFNEETVRAIPLESIFVETDTYQTPILSIYHKLSEATGVTLEKMTHIIENNTKNTFHL